MLTRLLRGAALALALLALGATACSSPLANCGAIFVFFGQDTLSFGADTVVVAAGDSTIATAHTFSGCPDQVGPAVTFATIDSSIATVRTLDDTSAIVKGLRAGSTGLTARSQGRPNIRSGIPLVVTAP